MNVAAPETLAEGRFRLLEPIGEGGMATVYRAFDLRLQRPRAIKVLSPALARRPPLRKRFLSEAHTMAGLEESRVVRIFDMGEDGDFVYIVMELVDGGSLLDRVRDYGPLPPRMAADATVQICESLQAAHDAGVIHRDIKPHNILLTRSGEIRVTDFGIAQVQTDDGEGMTKTGAVMGTWGFMAPEQKSNAKSVDARADVYSVGATLYSLLTGNTPPELFMADAEPTMLEGIPDELAEVIKRATRYRREDRYVSSRAMAESIRALVPLLPEDPEITVPLVPPAPERPVRPMDTMQQFLSEIAEPAGGGAGTMVPDLNDAPSLAPEAPRPEAAAPAVAAPEAAAGGAAPIRPAPATPPAPPLAPVDSLVTEPRPKKGPPWALLAGGALALVGVGGLALALAVPLLFGGGDDPTPVADGAAAPSGTGTTPSAADGAAVGGAAAAAGTPAPSDAAGADAAGAGATSAGVAGVATGAGASTPTTTPDAGRRPASGGATTTTAGASAVAGAAGSGTAAQDASATGTGATDASTAGTAGTTSAGNATASNDGVADAGPAPDATPSIRHTSPGEAKVGETLTFSAGLPGADWSVKLYYRPASGGPYQEKVMTGSGATYTAPVRVTDELGSGIAYFIAATKGSTTLRAGSPTSPKRVAAAQ